MHFCQYTISFFKSKSMSKLSRSDISSNQCTFMFAILLQLLLLFLYTCVFAYVIRIMDLSFICKYKLKVECERKVLRVLSMCYVVRTSSIHSHEITLEVWTTQDTCNLWHPSICDQDGVMCWFLRMIFPVS